MVLLFYNISTVKGSECIMFIPTFETTYVCIHIYIYIVSKTNSLFNHTLPSTYPATFPHIAAQSLGEVVFSVVSNSSN